MNDLPQMTLQDAITRLKTLDNIVNNNYSEAIYMVIKALEQLPCEDCISREEVIKLLEKEDWADTVEGVLALPPVRPRRKPGHWKWELASNGWANHICSECGFKENTDIHVKLNWRYCPKCGAEMGGDANG